MIYVWDATLLVHAQSADRADVLGDLIPTGRHITTDAVYAEINAGVPRWIEVVPSPQTDEFIASLITWRHRCGAAHGRNEGEASVLAYVDASFEENTAVIDDGPARTVGVRHLGAHRVHGSLWLLCQGILEDPSRRMSVSRFCDAMLSDGIRWPFGPRGIREVGIDGRVALIAPCRGL